MRNQTRQFFAVITLLVASTSSNASLIGIGAFSGDTFESFEGIGASLPSPNFGVTGIRGTMPSGFTTSTGLSFIGGTNYINDWSLGQANISSTGLSIFQASDVIDGNAYFFNYAGRVIIELGTTSTRFGAFMGGNGVQNTTFDMYLDNLLVDSFTTSGLTDFNNFTGWQSLASFNRIEWNGGHSGFDMFAFDSQEASVPEPQSLALLVLGLVGIVFSRNKKFI